METSAGAIVDHRDQRSDTGSQPHVVVSGPPITSIGGHCWMMGGEVSGLAALRRAVHQRAERQEAHRCGLPVTAHAHPVVAIEQAIEAGVDGIEHGTGLTATGTELPVEVLARLRERDIVVCPTLGSAPDAVPAPFIRELEARTGSSKERRQQLAARSMVVASRSVSRAPFARMAR